MVCFLFLEPRSECGHVPASVRELCVVCCVLFVVCCLLLCDVCCMLFVGCCVLCVVCCSVLCCVLCVLWCVVVCCLLFMCHPKSFIKNHPKSFQNLLKLTKNHPKSRFGGIRGALGRGLGAMGAGS